METQKNIILFLLMKKVATAVEIRNMLKKSPSVISVNLSDLFKEKIIEKQYDIPSNKYSLKNPDEIKGIMKEYYPTVLERLVENTTEILNF